MTVNESIFPHHDTVIETRTPIPSRDLYGRSDVACAAKLFRNQGGRDFRIGLVHFRLVRGIVVYTYFDPCGISVATGPKMTRNESSPHQPVQIALGACG